MWEAFRDHLEVLWGALVALGIVVALTPAVGGMARLLGVVDNPGGARPYGNATRRAATRESKVASTSGGPWEASQAFAAARVKAAPEPAPG